MVDITNIEYLYHNYLNMVVVESYKHLLVTNDIK